MNDVLGLTVEECEILIKRRLKNEDDGLLDYQVTPLAEGRYGIIGEHWILKINTKNGQKIRFFVKSPPQMESMVFYVKHIDIASKEEDFYQKVVPAMKQAGLDLIEEVAVQCHMVKKSQFLIFEDLSILGYKVYSSLESLSYEAVKVGLVTLAKFHACSLVFEENMSVKYGEKYRIIDHFHNEVKETFYCDELPSRQFVESIIKSITLQIELFPELFEDMDKESFKNFVTDTWKNVKEFVKPSKKFRNVICHGDTWSTNMMYKEENCKPAKCILIDFQLHRYTPPAQDVMLFLYLATDRKFRSKYKTECLDLYYEHLSSTLSSYKLDVAKIIPKNDFQSGCEYYELFGMAQCFSYFHLMKVTPTILKNFFDNPDASTDFLFNNRNEFIAKYCEQDPSYKEVQRESLLNFKDAFLKLKTSN
ncbi:hypothetical protein Trydic_g10333 [Trypoxylus dichotomus]